MSAKKELEYLRDNKEQRLEINHAVPRNLTKH